MLTTRFAPSPTGQLHLGHAYSAALAHKAACDAGGRVLLRIEDIDQTRSRPEFVEAIVGDLHWLEIDWDEEPLVQSKRGRIYEEALDRLKTLGLVYPCSCTRSDIAAALSAPHGPHPHYPGTCRNLPDDPGRRATTPHNWRLNAAKAIERVGLPSWIEVGGDRFDASVADIDDEILARKDAPASYHLACVVDDAASGVTLVSRGMDLRSSTPVQRLLQTLLDFPEPAYLHHHLILHEDGRRLAKRDKAPTLAAMRAAGVDGRELAQALVEGRLPAGFRLSEV